jgi:hypothetical protein
MTVMRDPIALEFLLAFWKVHILYHAADGRGVYGQWMLEELDATLWREIDLLGLTVKKNRTRRRTASP